MGGNGTEPAGPRGGTLRSGHADESLPYLGGDAYRRYAQQTRRSSPPPGRQAGAVVWIFFVLGLLPMALLLWIFAGQVNQQVDSQFTGEVIALSVQPVTLTTGMRTDYLLTIRADDGREFTLQVKDDVYALFAVGDRIVKPAGTRWPRKAA